MMSSLPTGFTDNSVTQIDGLVVKTGKNVSDEKAWYEAYLDKGDIPRIVGLEGSSLVMKFIERSGCLDTGEVIKVVEKYKRYKPLSSLPWDAYIDRIYRHLVTNDKIHNGGKLLEKLRNLKLPHTFCHGDLSVYNIIPTTEGIKLIDPLYSDNKFGSYLLDYAKLLFSIKFYQGDARLFKDLYKKIDLYFMDILIAAECVRVSGYKKQFSFIAENLINEL